MTASTPPPTARPSWHQRRGAERALGLHRWCSTDYGHECIRCGLEIDGDPDDYGTDDIGRCPGPD